MEDLEREFWVEFPYEGKNYTVGADIWGQGGWITKDSCMVVDENPEFYKHVAFISDKKVDINESTASFADLIMTNIYWHNQGEE